MCLRNIFWENICHDIWNIYIFGWPDSPGSRTWDRIFVRKYFWINPCECRGRIWPRDKFTASQSQRTTLVDHTGSSRGKMACQDHILLGQNGWTFKPFFHHVSLWLSVTVVRMWLWAMWLFTSDTIPEEADSWRLSANSTPCSWDNKLLLERGIWATHVRIHPNIQYYDALLQINTRQITQ